MFRLVCSLLVICLVVGAEAKKKTHASKLKALKKSASDSAKNETVRLNDCAEGEIMAFYGCTNVNALIVKLENDVIQLDGAYDYQAQQIRTEIDAVRSELGLSQGGGVGDENTAFDRIRSAEEAIEGLKINLGQSHLGGGPSPAFDEINDLRRDIGMIRTDPPMPEWMYETIYTMQEDIRLLKEKHGNDGTTDVSKLKAIKKSMSDSVKKEESTTRLDESEPCLGGEDQSQCTTENRISQVESEISSVRTDLGYPTDMDHGPGIGNVFSRLQHVEGLTQFANEALGTEFLEGTVNFRMHKLENALESVRSELGHVRTAASRMCQTGEIECDGCMGIDPFPGSMTYQYPGKVYFNPKFQELPTVTLAISRVWMEDPEIDTDYGLNERPPGKWGFRQEVRDLQRDGFTAMLHHADQSIAKHNAIWIACGNVCRELTCEQDLYG